MTDIIRRTIHNFSELGVRAVYIGQRPCETTHTLLTEHGYRNTLGHPVVIVTPNTNHPFRGNIDTQDVRETTFKPGDEHHDAYNGLIPKDVDWNIPASINEGYSANTSRHKIHPNLTLIGKGAQ